MELNDESDNGAASAENEAPVEKPEATKRPKKSKPADESDIEAEVEAEIEADVASYEAEVESEVAESKVEAEKEAVAAQYDSPWVPTSPPDENRQSLLRRLSPYLTVAGVLLIARIVVYSLRRRRR
ncbi:MAG: hypothetical protein ABSD85_13820 [Acidimicrobiales bacterium]|jgi:hypothetical protein